MCLVVIEQKRRQSVNKFFLKLEGQILNEVIEAPFMRALLKLYVITVAEG